MQLLVCDWLIETRTALWEDSVENGLKAPVSNTVLTAFQKDLNSLRTLAEHTTVMIFYFIAIAYYFSVVFFFYSLPLREFSCTKQLPD